MTSSTCSCSPDSYKIGLPDRGFGCNRVCHLIVKRKFRECPVPKISGVLSFIPVVHPSGHLSFRPTNIVPIAARPFHICSAQRVLARIPFCPDPRLDPRAHQTPKVVRSPFYSSAPSRVFHSIFSYPYLLPVAALGCTLLQQRYSSR
jgi:hypothetical protein